MKTKNLILLIFFLTSFNIYDAGYISAQPKSGDHFPDLIPYRKGNKLGFCNKDKKIIIPVKYDEASYGILFQFCQF